MLKRPDTLTDARETTPNLIRRHDSETWSAYQLQDSVRDIVTARGIDEHVATLATIARVEKRPSSRAATAASG